MGSESVAFMPNMLHEAEARSGAYTVLLLEDFKDSIELQTRSFGLETEPSCNPLGSLEKRDENVSNLLNAHTGWRRGILYCIGTALGVLFCALAFMGWANTLSRQSASGIPVLYRGGCKTSKNISAVAHVVVNVLSTLLLGAGNYCMHILSAPSRRDINKIHSAKKVLDIGINSVKNIFKLAWDRRVVWCLLALSSIPLHLTSNSVVYATTTAYEYYAAVVTTDFFQGGSWTTSTLGPKMSGMYGNIPPNPSAEWQSWMQGVQNGDIQLSKLDNKACVQTYATPFVTNSGNLILITDARNPNTFTYDNNTLLTVNQGVYNQSGRYRSYASYNWMCAESSMDDTWGLAPSCSSIRNDPAKFTIDIWTNNNYSGVIGGNSHPFLIDSCLSQTLEQQCTVEASLVLLGVVIAFVSCKLLCMFWVLWQLKEHPLVVIGDAITSFVKEPDTNTKGACLGISSDFNHTQSWLRLSPRKWSPKLRRWSHNVSRGQWATCILLCIIALSIALYLLCSAIVNFKIAAGANGSPIAASGFNTIHPTFMLHSIIFKTGNNASSPSGLLPAVLLANLPQLIVSFIYVSYNSILTSMLMGLEWSRYAHMRKPLRVSYPTGLQRSTYRLQIPYRYGVMLMMLIGSIHLLVSESIFVVRLQVFTFTGKEDLLQSMVTCGYSLLALLITIIVGAVAVLGLIGIGFRSYEPGMSLVGCSSAAISAACHSRPDEDIDAALQPLQWGAVPFEGEIGHCCFSTGPVLLPRENRVYA